ncbi:serine/threonine-protein kinase [Nonomuraea endophytica]|uniref:non-specific serine/threonine protein kinase n=1 Tax=Nonomuraea endophytica TaxID=714136 RepID=A0A7W8A2F5_9ACTN|nr:serine/threonine-protein kinase [Nonomuraea endophytica]MBB5077556.1 putative Ser/Thr protein kinase [Nonomuraea endophytica]
MTPPSVGPYRIVRKLGEGGQGVVYLGQAPDGAKVAVKVLREGGDGLAREVAALRRVEPFCVAQVLDASTGGRPYIVTEYVEGPSLAEAGRHGGAGLQRLAVATATALAAIHRAGVVHRDFKPGNVLLGRDGPRVIDFGIARSGASLTVTSSVVGTPAYMAPEQLAGAGVGPATDVFAWAGVMVYAATGSPPFGNDSLPAVITRIQHADPDLGDLTGPLRPIVTRCLAKNPAARPTMQEVLFQLIGAGAPPDNILPEAGVRPGSPFPGPANRTPFPGPSDKTPFPGPSDGTPSPGPAGGSPFPGTGPHPSSGSGTPDGMRGGQRRRGSGGPVGGDGGNDRERRGSGPGGPLGGDGGDDRGPRGSGPGGPLGGDGGDDRGPRGSGPGGPLGGHGGDGWRRALLVAGAAAGAVVVTSGLVTALVTGISWPVAQTPPGLPSTGTPPAGSVEPAVKPTAQKSAKPPRTPKPTATRSRTRETPDAKPTADTKPTADEQPTTDEPTQKPTTSKPAAPAGRVGSVSLRSEGLRTGDCYRQSNIAATVSASKKTPFTYRWILDGRDMGKAAATAPTKLVLGYAHIRSDGAHTVQFRVLSPNAMTRTFNFSTCDGAPWPEE